MLWKVDELCIHDTVMTECYESGLCTWYNKFNRVYIDGLVQEKRNSIAYALEVRLCCTNPSISQWMTRISAQNILVVPMLCSWSNIMLGTGLLTAVISVQLVLSRQAGYICHIFTHGLSLCSSGINGFIYNIARKKTHQENYNKIILIHK